MTEMIVMPFRKPNYVTPYLPEAALMAASVWEAQRKQPVFVLAIDSPVSPSPATDAARRGEARRACPNCGGLGAVYLRFCESGPHSAPTGGVITWYDGDGVYRRGWYRVAETKIFPCPHCQKGEK